MNNPEKDRLEAKLKLWDTPGFESFLAELADYVDIVNVQTSARTLRKMYKAKLGEIEAKENRFKQGKLEL